MYARGSRSGSRSEIMTKQEKEGGRIGGKKRIWGKWQAKRMQKEIPCRVGT